VNRYAVAEERPPDLLRVPLEVEGRQIDRVRRWKRERNAADARTALARVRAAAEGSDNLMPVLVDAVKAGCTVGEVADVYRSVFGVYQDPAWL
jgi:methylmalonyl-CoA mutase N-terminal domain/subunit